MINRSKRRKSKDNPYTLLNIDEKGIYKVAFKDGVGKFRIVEITREVYEAFDRFELEDKSQMNKYERHIEHSEIFENSIYERVMDKPISLEDEIIRKSTFEDLKNAIEQLPEIQKRRIKKYYFEDKNEYQIADEENTTQQAVNKTLSIARENLKELLKK
jgi:RNA polymerase sigma-70 factor (ECF subfamily)